MILEKTDCEIARTPEGLIAWIEAVFAQIDTDKHVAEREYGLTKRFYEEIVPLSYLAHHKYLGLPNILLRPKTSNQNYDAEIIDCSQGERVTHIEFVSSYRGQDLALRIEHLAQHGIAPMTGHVWRHGTKATGGQVHVQLIPVDHETIVTRTLSAIQKMVLKKLTKPYERGIILAVVIDDFSLNRGTRCASCC